MRQIIQVWTIMCGLSRFCGRQSLKNLLSALFEYFVSYADYKAGIVRNEKRGWN